MLDFRGPWVSDSDVQLSMSMTDMVVRLPREAQVNGLGTDRSESPLIEELPLPTLSFSVESGRRTTLRVFE